MISYYEPDIVTAQDYYPFGMMSRVALPNSGVPYKFGFNGKMNDNEVKGLGLQQDYGMRIYDNRAGRFLSVDPLTRDYAELTPYQFASNSPIQGIDLDGGELQLVTDWLADKAKASGHPTLSGFVRGLGALDIEAQKAHLMVNSATGNYRAVAKQLYGYSLKGMVDNLEATTKRAINDNDQEAYGELYSFVFLGALGDAGMGEPPAIEGFKFSEHPVAKTNKLAIEAHGNVEAIEGNAANTTTNRVNATGKEGSWSSSSGGQTINSKNLKLGHKESTITSSSSYQKIKKLSDKELIESVLHPNEYDPVRINAKTGTLSDGNTRIYEIQRRGLSVDVPVKEYYPDDSMFPTPKEPPTKKQ
ncbi:hypothetical protein A4H97_24180 [Niastella yeongjuensis]|uniref:RHS repeat-associated core domain-containing protein n=1 Tax=Niastella yeongjuensis TaxID=354355 RepID=A0A1V9F3F1_9BACT|nr:hypothetical protein A4H97_24180 [Niastella yeongjuensis]